MHQILWVETVVEEDCSFVAGQMVLEALQLLLWLGASMPQLARTVFEEAVAELFWGRGMFERINFVRRLFVKSSSKVGAKVPQDVVVFEGHKAQRAEPLSSLKYSQEVRLKSSRWLKLLLDQLLKTVLPSLVVEQSLHEF